MPHVELSLIEDPSRLTRGRPAPAAPPDDAAQATTLEPRARERSQAGSSLDRWAVAVTAAAEPSLVLDMDAVIVAASASCAELIGLGDPTAARGRQLRDAVLRLVDFTDSLDDLDRAEAEKIPPLLAISSGRLARGLIRLACPQSQAVNTMDAIATPLRDGPDLVGSLTFFARI